jgi:hypothetical protein
MTWREYLFLFVVALLVALTLVALQPVPGYMDAAYYYSGALRLAQGHGFTEMMLWNYLDNPSGLPHPSHTYWNPLISIVAAGGMLLTGRDDFNSARIFLVLFATLFPLVTAALAWQFSPRRETAVLAGLLAIFSVYTLSFVVTTDNFSTYPLIGAAYFLLLGRPKKWTPFVLGLLAGLLNLARSDGLLWMPVTLLVSVLLGYGSLSAPGLPRGSRAWSAALAGFVSLAGYALVMGPWYARSLALFGSLLPPGPGRMLWTTVYDQVFIYPADSLTFQAWWAHGWQAALKVRLWAVGQNLINMFAAQGSILLFPFILIGIWQKRRELGVRVAVVAWTLLFLAQSLLFPFAGVRGGFFHAGMVYQPMWWALAPLGLDHVVGLARKHGWFTVQAFRIFRLALLAMVVTLSVILVNMRVIKTGWNEGEYTYQQVERTIVENGARPGDIIMAANPPAYYAMTGRAVIVLPYGDEQTLLAAARRYGARYVVLERISTLDPLKDLYDHPENYPEFTPLGDFDGARLYLIRSEP